MLKEVLSNLNLFAQTLASANAGTIADWRSLNLKEQLKKNSEINYPWKQLSIRDNISGECVEAPKGIYEKWKNASIEDIERDHKKRIRKKDNLLAYDDIKRHLVTEKNLSGYNVAVVMNEDKIYNDPQISQEKKNLIRQKINITTTENGKTRVIRPGDHITGTGKMSSSALLKLLQMRKEYTEDIEELEDEWKYYVDNNKAFSFREKRYFNFLRTHRVKPHIMSLVLWRYWFEAGLIDTDIYYGGVTADGKYIYNLYFRKFNTMDNNTRRSSYKPGLFDYRQFQYPAVFFSNIRPDAKGFEKLLLQTFGTQMYQELNFPIHSEVFSSFISSFAKLSKMDYSDNHADVYAPLEERKNSWIDFRIPRQKDAEFKKRTTPYFHKFSWCDMLNIDFEDHERLHWRGFPLFRSHRFEKINIPISKLSKQTLKMGYTDYEPTYLDRLLQRWFGIELPKFEGSFTVKAGELLKAVKEKFSDDALTFLLVNHFTTLRPWENRRSSRHAFDVKIVPKFKNVTLEESKEKVYKEWLKLTWVEEKTNTQYKKEDMFSAPYEWLRNPKENMDYYEEREFDIFRTNLLSSNKDLTIGFVDSNGEEISRLKKSGLEIEDLYFEIDVMVAELWSP